MGNIFIPIWKKYILNVHFCQNCSTHHFWAYLTKYISTKTCVNLTMSSHCLLVEKKNNFVHKIICFVVDCFFFRYKYSRKIVFSMTIFQGSTLYDKLTNILSNRRWFSMLKKDKKKRNMKEIFFWFS